MHLFTNIGGAESADASVSEIAVNRPINPRIPSVCCPLDRISALVRSIVRPRATEFPQVKKNRCRGSVFRALTRDDYAFFHEGLFKETKEARSRDVKRDGVSKIQVKRFVDVAASL